MGFYQRDKAPELTKWKCEDCHDKKGRPIRSKLIRRCCSLEEYKKYVPENKRLHLRLGNDIILDTCPVSTLDPWAKQMWSDFHFFKEFGVTRDLPEITYKAFCIIINEMDKILNLKDRRAKVEAAKRKLQGER